MIVLMVWHMGSNLNCSHHLGVANLHGLFSVQCVVFQRISSLGGLGSPHPTPPHLCGLRGRKGVVSLREVAGWMQM